MATRGSNAKGKESGGKVTRAVHTAPPPQATKSKKAPPPVQKSLPKPAAPKASPPKGGTANGDARRGGGPSPAAAEGAPAKAGRPAALAEAKAGAPPRQAGKAAPGVVAPAAKAEAPPAATAPAEARRPELKPEAKPEAKTDAKPQAAVRAEAPPAPGAGQEPVPYEPLTPTPSPAQPSASPQPPLLFEVAWEVCWQLGGIYTVLRSKAAAMLERWGDRYCLVGPYNPQTAAVEFEEQPTYGSIRDTMQRLKESGLPCYFGRWLIAGRPRVILIDYRARYGSLSHDKYLMWTDHGISTSSDDGEVNEVIAFGFAVAEFFRLFTQVVKDRPILAHFHEWMGGVAVPRIAHMRLPVATVFTTHATLLGRWLASDNPYFYDHLPFLNPDAEAAKYQIYPRFAIERAAAHASVVFTTVSEVTAVEAEKLLGRKPEVIVPNGLNIQRFAAPHEFQHLHAQYKEQINEFVVGHFFPSYTFDLDRTVYLFTSGRYEYRNKGMDVFIEAMSRLNWRLKHVANPPTVVAFIITKAQTRNVNVDVLRNQTMFDDLKHTCDTLKEQMGARLLRSASHARMPTFNELLPEDSQVRLKRALHAWKSHRQPLIVTHDLADDAGDPVLKHLRHKGMFNAADDPVKMIFHPEFVTATAPTISLDYEQFVRGCHMGIFPSYYEPWGYTPMECVALGLPAVTTDLSGFGAYVERHMAAGDQQRRRFEDQGILVLNRRSSSFDQTTDALVDHLFQFLQLDRRQRIEHRNRVERLGERFDWSTLVKHYDEAHNLALERTGSKRLGSLEVRVV